MLDMVSKILLFLSYNSNSTQRLKIENFKFLENDKPKTQNIFYWRKLQGCVIKYCKYSVCLWCLWYNILCSTERFFAKNCITNISRTFMYQNKCHKLLVISKFFLIDFSDFVRNWFSIWKFFLIDFTDWVFNWLTELLSLWNWKWNKMSKESETDDVKEIVEKGSPEKATKTTESVLQPPTTQSQLGIYSKKT